MQNPMNPQFMEELAKMTPEEQKKFQTQVLDFSENFRRMADACFKKCIHYYEESMFEKGESVCINRCLWKFVDVSNMVRAKMEDYDAKKKKDLDIWLSDKK